MDINHLDIFNVKFANNGGYLPMLSSLDLNRVVRYAIIGFNQHIYGRMEVVRKIKINTIKKVKRIMILIIELIFVKLVNKEEISVLDE
jgi:hypothetical protein